MVQKLIQTQAQKQVQVQRLTQQQMLVVKLLEMPLTELEQSVTAELDDNPALESRGEGDEPVHDEPQDGGADAKDEDLTMVDFEVKPIHELVGALDAKKGEEVKRYIENEYKK